MQALQSLDTAHQIVGKETGGEGTRAISCEVQHELLERRRHTCKSQMFLIYFHTLLKKCTIILVKLKYTEVTAFSLPLVDYFLRFCSSCDDTLKSDGYTVQF